ncbi:MAG: hypothetical protein J2P25_26365, partial [Nocardiopsaceae bacterium]|nr:hypothetical protein [Nocardiopsaceae bacterium]
MKATCPRCGGKAQAPTAWSSAWRCASHGEIHPLSPARQPSADGLNAMAGSARVPLWLPWPLPHGWLVTGFAGAGDERTGLRGTAMALSGPHPLGCANPPGSPGPADLVVVAE